MLREIEKKKKKRKKEKKEKGHFSTFPCGPGHPVFPRRYLPVQNRFHGLPGREPDPSPAFSLHLGNVCGSEAASQAEPGVTPRSFSTGKGGGINPLCFLHLKHFAVAARMLVTVKLRTPDLRDSGFSRRGTKVTTVKVRSDAGFVSRGGNDGFSQAGVSVPPPLGVFGYPSGEDPGARVHRGAVSPPADPRSRAGRGAPTGAPGGAALPSKPSAASLVWSFATFFTEVSGKKMGWERWAEGLCPFDPGKAAQVDPKRLRVVLSSPEPGGEPLSSPGLSMFRRSQSFTSLAFGCDIRGGTPKPSPALRIPARSFPRPSRWHPFGGGGAGREAIV